MRRAGSVAAVSEESLGYEQAREELAEVVRRLDAALEAGDGTTPADRA